MTLFHILRVTPPTSTSPALVALSDAGVAFGSSFFAVLAAMSFAAVAVNPWAALYGALISGGGVFFITLQRELVRIPPKVV